MITATQIHKSFDGKSVFGGIDMILQPGEITCLIGPSGTGKTTLLRALSMLDLPDQGTISINGHDYDFPLHKPCQDHLAHNPPWPDITAVFQSLFLWPHMTLRENILLPARARNPEAQKDLNGLINLFEMGHFIDKYPNQASIGQRQRIALARALILNPKYIFMDEITSALDIEQTAKILTKLGHLRNRGIGVFLITHHLGFARKIADHVVFMSDGQIVESGPPHILDMPSSQRLKTFTKTNHDLHV